MKKKPAKKSNPATDYTHVHLILDRSGSMVSIRNDVVGGLNRFIDEQKAAPGKCTFTLVQFDTQDPYEVVCDCVDVKAVKPIGDQYQPRGGTPLYDSMGKGITALDAQLGGMDKKPKNVVVVVMTDGEENSSHEFTKDKIAAMTKEKTAKGWHFVYLGANQDAMQVGHGIGVAQKTSANYTPRNTMRAMAVTCSNLSNLRSGAVMDMAYSASQRDELTATDLPTIPPNNSSAWVDTMAKAEH